MPEGGYLLFDQADELLSLRMWSWHQDKLQRFETGVLAKSHDAACVLTMYRSPC